MKKYGLVIILALCVAIGGVFATWTFAQGTVDDAKQDISIEIEGEDLLSAKGTIQVENNLTVSIVKAASSYDAELKLDGNVVITFVPADGADEDVVNSGIAMQYAIAAPSNTYLEGAIFEADSEKYDIGSGAVRTYTIEAQELANHIRLAQTINLPNHDTYTSFKSALSGATITLTISEK